MASNLRPSFVPCRSAYFNKPLFSASRRNSSALVSSPPPKPVRSPLLPMTHALEVARGLLLADAGVAHLELRFAALAAFSLLLPVGLWTLGWSVRWARRTGSLAYY